MRQAWNKSIFASGLRTHVLGALWQEGKVSLLLLPTLNKRGLEPPFALLLSFDSFQSSCLFVLVFSLYMHAFSLSSMIMILACSTNLLNSTSFSTCYK